MCRKVESITALLVVVIFTSGGIAAPVTGPWTSATGQGNGPITQEDTSSPIVGDGTANSADAEMFDSPFPAITLTNPGDKILFTGTMQLVGTINSPATTPNPRTQFRFGLFEDDDGSTDDIGWLGYLMTNAHGTGTPQGTISRKPSGNTSTYLSTTGANSLAATQGNGTVFNDDTYALSLSIERNGVGDLSLSGSITGTAATNFTQVLSAVDLAATVPTYTFDHLGFLLGGNLDTDQAFFTNLDVKLVQPIVGDYNSDGEVNTADYVLWREAVETQTALANDPLGLPIDDDQYIQWKQNFGDTTPGSSSILLRASAVPEPASAILILVFGGVVACLARRR